MKLFIPVENDAGLESRLDRRFARAGYFLIYDMEKEEIVLAQENPYKNEEQGAGIKAATYVVAKGCQGTVGAQPGPKAASVLEEGDVKVTFVNGGTLREALDKFICI